VVTNEHRRFAEFCDASRRYRSIGVCYGAPGVGTTLSARRQANWANLEDSRPAREASTEALTALWESQTVCYTPPVLNTPAHVERDIRGLRAHVRQRLQQQGVPSGVACPSVITARLRPTSASQMNAAGVRPDPPIGFVPHSDSVVYRIRR
jgi:hypothetical protein